MTLPVLPLPGRGATWERLVGLAKIARDDLEVARLIEGHADAAAILADAGAAAPEPGERWGVWASAPTSLTAEPDETGWWLTGDRPWCTAATWCTHVVVTAPAAGGIRMFAVRNDPGGARSPVGSATPAGHSDVDGRSVRFSRAHATAIGRPGDYVSRPGFWHAAVGVAAVWFGGALGVADSLYAAARQRELPPPALVHLGAVDVALCSARAVLRGAAADIDADPHADAHRLALRVRGAVHATVVEVVDRVSRAWATSTLGRDARHTRRVAELLIYVRQSYADSDLTELGRMAERVVEPAR